VNGAGSEKFAGPKPPPPCSAVCSYSVMKEFKYSRIALRVRSIRVPGRRTGEMVWIHDKEQQHRVR